MINSNRKFFRSWMARCLCITLVSSQILGSTSIASYANGYSTIVPKMFRESGEPISVYGIQDSILLPGTEFDLYSDIGVEMLGDDLEIIPFEILSGDGEIFPVPRGMKKFHIPEGAGKTYTVKYIVKSRDTVGAYPNANGSGGSGGSGYNANIPKTNTEMQINANSSNSAAGSLEDDRVHTDSNTHRPLETETNNADDSGSTGNPEIIPTSYPEPTEGSMETESISPTIESTTRMESSEIQTIPELSKEIESSTEKETEVFEEKPTETLPIEKEKPTYEETKELPRQTTSQAQELIEKETTAKSTSTEAGMMYQTTSESRVLERKIWAEDSFHARHFLRNSEDSDRNSGEKDPYVFDARIRFDGSKLEESLVGAYVDLKVPLAMLSTRDIYGHKNIHGILIDPAQEHIERVEYRGEVGADGKKYIKARIYLKEITAETSGDLDYQIRFHEELIPPGGFMTSVSGIFYHSDGMQLLTLENAEFWVSRQIVFPVPETTLSETEAASEEETAQTEASSTSALETTPAESQARVEETQEESKKKQTVSSPQKKEGKPRLKKEIEKKDITVDIQWLGDVLQKQDRPLKLTLQLYRKNGKDQKEKIAEKLVLSQGVFLDTWTARFEDVELTDEEGKPYSFEVSIPEAGVHQLANYSFASRSRSAEMINVFLRYSPINLKAEIIWDDNANEHQVRPKQVEADLLRSSDGVRFELVQDDILFTSSDWQKNLGLFPRYNTSGEKYEYQLIEEDSPELSNYPKVIYEENGQKKENRISSNVNNTLSLTNKIEEIRIPFEIQWEDSALGSAYRPQEVTVKLNRAVGEKKIVLTETVSGGMNTDIWKGAFGNLVRYDSNGNAYQGQLSGIKDLKLQNYRIEHGGSSSSVQELTYIPDLTEHEVSIQVLGAGSGEESTSSFVRLYRTEAGSAQDIPVGIPIRIGPSFTFKDLPRFSESGKKYEYFVLPFGEDLNYTIEEQIQERGKTIITKRFQAVELKVDWIWNEEGGLERPDTVRLLLKRSYNGQTELVKEATVSTEQGYVFEDLPKYAPNGSSYRYTVEQILENGSDNIITDYIYGNEQSVMIENRLQENALSVRVEWADEGNQYHTRPEFITLRVRRRTKDTKFAVVGEDVRLYRDAGLSTDSQAYEGGDIWKYTFENLPRFSPENEEYIYEIFGVDSSDIHGYAGVEYAAELQQDGSYVLDYRLKKDKLSFRIDSEGLNPTLIPEVLNIRLHRFADGELDKDFQENLSISTLGNAEMHREVLAYRTDGMKYEYRAELLDSPKWKNYQIELQKDSPSSFVLKISEQNMDIQVVSMWNDENNRHSLRPAKEKISLARRAEKDTEFVLLDQHTYMISAKDALHEGIWSHTFTDLARFDSRGNAYEYTVVSSLEDNSRTGNYRIQVENGDGQQITLIHDLKTREIGADIFWEGDHEFRESRPEYIELNLYQTGESGESKKVDTILARGNGDIWTGDFDAMPEFDSKGKPYIYTIAYAENSSNWMANYAVEYPVWNEQKRKIEIVNTLKAQQLYLHMDWQDEENAEQVRPSSVDLILERSLDRENFTIVNENISIRSSENSVNLGRYPMRDINGREFTYRIRQKDQISLRNYSVNAEPVQNTNGEIEGFLIQNTLITQDIPVRIRFAEEVVERPAFIELDLTRNGTTPIPTYTRKVSGSEEEEFWETSYPNLLRYTADGNPFIYTLRLSDGQEVYAIQEERVENGIRTLVLQLVHPE